MRKQSKESMQVILQMPKMNWTSYRALVLHHSKLYVVEIRDTTNIDGKVTWVSTRHTYRDRAGQLFKALAHQKGYCNMGSNYFERIGNPPKSFAKMLLPILSKDNKEFSFRDYDTWKKYFKLPLIDKYNRSLDKNYDWVVPY